MTVTHFIHDEMKTPRGYVMFQHHITIEQWYQKQGLDLPDLEGLAFRITLPLQEQAHSISPPFISSGQIGTALKRWP